VVVPLAPAGGCGGRARGHGGRWPARLGWRSRVAVWFARAAGGPRPTSDRYRP